MGKNNKNKSIIILIIEFILSLGIISTLVVAINTEIKFYLHTHEVIAKTIWAAENGRKFFDVNNLMYQKDADGKDVFFHTYNDDDAYNKLNIEYEKLNVINNEWRLKGEFMKFFFKEFKYLDEYSNCIYLTLNALKEYCEYIDKIPNRNISYEVRFTISEYDNKATKCFGDAKKISDNIMILTPTPIPTPTVTNVKKANSYPNLVTTTQIVQPKITVSGKLDKISMCSKSAKDRV